MTMASGTNDIRIIQSSAPVVRKESIVPGEANVEMVNENNESPNYEPPVPLQPILSMSDSMNNKGEHVKTDNKMAENAEAQQSEEMKANQEFPTKKESWSKDSVIGTTFGPSYTIKYKMDNENDEEVIGDEEEYETALPESKNGVIVYTIKDNIDHEDDMNETTNGYAIPTNT